jgi:hypothetical protein
VDAVFAIERLLAPGTEVKPACTRPDAFSVIDEGGTEPVQIPVEPVTEIPTSFSPARITPHSSETAPGTFLRRHPPKVLRTAARTARAVFRFGSNEAGVVFLCKFDRARFRVCARRIVRRFGLGRHVLRVKARDRDGDTDPTPAVFRFRVLPAG